LVHQFLHDETTIRGATAPSSTTTRQREQRRWAVGYAPELASASSKWKCLGKAFEPGWKGQLTAASSPQMISGFFGKIAKMDPDLATRSTVLMLDLAPLPINAVRLRQILSARDVLREESLGSCGRLKAAPYLPSTECRTASLVP
jgi:hypothetical protein